MFKRNEGNVDRGIRIVLGVIALIVSALYLSGTVQIAGYVLGAIALVTGIVGHCGLYSLLGISTCPAEDNVADKKEQ